jgi:hypothetical protein
MDPAGDGLVLVVRISVAQDHRADSNPARGSRLTLVNCKGPLMD